MLGDGIYRLIKEETRLSKMDSCHLQIPHFLVDHLGGQLPADLLDCTQSCWSRQRPKAT